MARVFAIGDLHWSTTKPMDRFGDHWRDHRRRLIDAWWERITHSDLVLLPGDLTFARDPSHDLGEINRLPGQKVVTLGNHDRWAQGITQTKLRQLLEPFPTIHVLNYEKPYYETGDHLVVGWKGSEPPESNRFKSSSHSKTLEHARNAARKVEPLVASTTKLIVATHYPPSQKERAAVEHLVPALWLHGHSHLHGDDEGMVRGWMRERSGPEQFCVSGDYIDHTPVEVTNGVVQIY